MQIRPVGAKYIQANRRAEGHYEAKRPFWRLGRKRLKVRVKSSECLNIGTQRHADVLYIGDHSKLQHFNSKYHIYESECMRKKASVAEFNVGILNLAFSLEDCGPSTEYSKGNKTVPEKVVITRIEDGQKQNTKTSTTIQTKNDEGA